MGLTHKIFISKLIESLKGLIMINKQYSTLAYVFISFSAHEIHIIFKKYFD
jgi:hypothetical protein